MISTVRIKHVFNGIAVLTDRVIDNECNISSKSLKYNLPKGGKINSIP